ncbi:MAG: hypothetical protein FP833_08720 [Atribacteria sp.]|nr:hypothetical protein [Candidatus Atribacteria bacterium]
MSNYKIVNYKDTESATDETIIPEIYEPTEAEKKGETLAGTPPSEDYERITGRTPTDLAFFLINKINGSIYTLFAGFFAVLLYGIAISTGHLKNKEDFLWVTLAIAATSLIIPLCAFLCNYYNLFKKKK